MADTLYKDILAAQAGDLDLDLVKRFADLNVGGENHAQGKLMRLLTESGMPKMSLERMTIRNGVITEDDSCKGMPMFIH